MVTDEQQIERVMDALGHQTRRDILALLHENALPVGDIPDRARPGETRTPRRTKLPSGRV